jgi:hypothetical protein
MMPPVLLLDFLVFERSRLRHSRQFEVGFLQKAQFAILVVVGVRFIHLSG